MPLGAAGLMSLDDHHERQDHRVKLLGRAGWAKTIDRCVDFILKTAVDFDDFDGRRFGLLRVAENAGVNPGKMGKVGQIFDHARSIGLPLTLRVVGFPNERRVVDLPGKLRYVEFGLAETHPDQTMALLDRVGPGARLGGYFAFGRQGGNLHAAAVGAVVPTMIGTDEFAAVDPAERQSGAAMQAKIVKRRDRAFAAPQYEGLSEQFYRGRLVAEFLRPKHRVPKLFENAHRISPHTGTAHRFLPDGGPVVSREKVAIRPMTGWRAAVQMVYRHSVTRRPQGS